MARRKELRAMSPEELAEKESELRESLARLAMQRYARRLDKTSDLKARRKELARVLTMIREKRLVTAAGGAD